MFSGEVSTSATDVPNTIISVYMDDGRVFEYQVKTPDKGIEHASRIILTGYRRTPSGENSLEWYPAHRIDKVRVSNGGETTKYRDSVRAT